MKLYNSRTRAVEEVMPLDGKTIRIYTCGPTVYNFAHIGNFRAYIAADLLKRALKWRGFSVSHTMNITDVDDKMIANSQKEFPDMEPMQALMEFGKKYTDAFWQDYHVLNILPPDTVTKATEYIIQMQSLITAIVHKGFGYEKDGSVYFDVQKYAREKHYGELMNIDMSGFQAGARIDADEYEKEHVQDFALWKARKEGEPFWDFELSGKPLPGRPGWHIECSAMGQDTLGLPFDIHTGGVDLKFPHHEDEIAQSAIGYAVDVPVNIWMHNEFLNVEGEKMAKSKHNFYTLRDILEKKYSPAAIRYVLLSTHYRQPLNFTFDGLAAAQEAIDRISEVVYQCANAGHPLLLKEGRHPQGDGVVPLAGGQRNSFLEEGVTPGVMEGVLKIATENIATALDDDLNISKTLGVLFETITEINTQKLYGPSVIDWLKNIDTVLGLGVETPRGGVSASENPALQSLLSRRQKAREENNFALSDRLREQIESQFKVELRDTEQGQTMKEKP